MKINIFRQRKSRKIALITICLLILVTGIIVTFLYITRDTSPIPAQIKKQLTFSPFILPNNVKNYTTTEYKFSTAEDKVPILSYVIKLKDNTITLSEYPQPPQFTDIPEFKDRFLTNVANQYDTVSSSSGTIYLGRAVKQKNKQLAVMIERGLLVLMMPEKDMDSSQWRNLGDQLEIQKINN